MKKIIMLMLCCCMLVGLTACGGSDEKTIDNGPAATKTPTSDDGTDNTKTPDQAQNSTGGKQETSSQGYVFTYKETEVKIDADATPYVEAFGEPVSYYETPSCAFDNLDKFYTYHGFELDTYYMNGKDLVLGIVFLDDTVSTTEGICIGDTKEKVIKVYGEPTESTDNSATYKKDNMKLVLIFKDGVVASIEYKSMVLEEQ